jgi:outer membrane receptor for ferrienterochelin and colicins
VGVVIELDPVVVSASRRQERAINTPASVSVVPTVEITERPALSVTDHLKALPGVDISQGGLVQANVVGRGFNNIFSGALLTLTDYRYASVPSLRVNVPAFFPGTNDDIERVEFVLGPGAALYGPNAANGVLSIITKSPITSPGTSVSLETGYRVASRNAADTKLDGGHSVLKAGFRHAGRVSERFGYKISGEYLTAEEWKSRDPAEPTSLPGRQCSAEFGCRNFNLEKYGFDVRLDWRPVPDAEIVGAVGRTTALSLIEYTGIGAAQADGWRYDYAQLRGRWNKLFAQVFQNRSDAGSDSPSDRTGSFLLRDGNPIVDKSRVTGVQAQYGVELAGGREDVIFGVDYTFTDPRTLGTINGRNEDTDNIKEIGGYASSTTRLTDHLDLIAALRVDKHSRLKRAVWSPRAALLVMPTPLHSLRFTYNRAFSTPTSNNLSLDILAGMAGPYRVRALGVPRTGFGFRGFCGTGGVDNLCMWPGPFPGTPAAALPANAALLWPVAVGAVRAALPPAVGGALASTPAPTTQVGTQLRRLDPTARVFVDVGASTVRDVAPLEPTISNVLEVGYKGIVNNRFRLSVDAYYEKKENFVGPLIVESPNVFLDPATTLAYLMANFKPRLEAGGVPPAQATVITQQVAVAMSGISGSANPSTVGVPLGTVVPDTPLNQAPDIFLTYRNFGSVDLWGADLAVDYLFDDRWSVAASYSLVSDDFFPAQKVGGPSDVALNASKSKGSVTWRYRDEPGGLSAELRGRYVKGFPVNSGVYVSPTRPDGSLQPIDSYGLVDAQVSWRVPGTNGLQASLLAENLLNNNYTTFVGLPRLGRLVMTKLQYAF